MTRMAQSQSGNGWFRAQKWLKLLNYLYLAKEKKIRIEGWPKWAISKMAWSGNGLKVYIITKLLTYFKKIKTIYKVQNNWELAWKAQLGFGPNGLIRNWPKWPDRELTQIAWLGIDPNHLVEVKAGHTWRKTVKVPVYICADHLHLFAWSCVFT